MDHLEPYEQEVVVKAASECAKEYVAYMNAASLGGLDSCLHFPHIIVRNDHVIIWAKAGMLSKSYFSDMVASGWQQTQLVRQYAVLMTPKKVHLSVHYVHRRGDRTVLAEHREMWIITDENGRWGVRVRSV